MKYLFIVIYIFCVFVSCTGQRKKETSEENKISSITFNYIGGMGKPSDTQFCYKIDYFNLYKLRSIYTHKQNNIKYDSVILSKRQYDMARSMIDSLPKYVYNSIEEQIGSSSNANDGSYLHLLIEFENRRTVEIFNQNVPNEIKNYMIIANRIYFSLAYE